MTYVLDPIRPRFILDAYAIVNGQAVPLTAAQARKFSTPTQAREVFSQLPDGVTAASIAEGTVDTEFGDLHSNQREAWDHPMVEDDPFILVINCTVTIKSKQIGQPDVTGPMNFNVGEILAQRFLLGASRDKAKLVLDEIGQLKYSL